MLNIPRNRQDLLLRWRLKVRGFFHFFLKAKEEQYLCKH